VRYNTATGQWTWVSGSKTFGQSGIYGTKNGAPRTNVPGARETAMCWLDPSGNFLALGGFTNDSLGNPAAFERYVGIHGRANGFAEWRQRCQINKHLRHTGRGSSYECSRRKWSAASWTDAIETSGFSVDKVRFER